MSKALQVATRIKAFYALEFISERFDGSASGTRTKRLFTS
jgi:hypothetical protein